MFYRCVLWSAVACGCLALATSAHGTSDPRVEIRPLGNSPAHVQAMVDSGTTGVHLNLSWEAVEPKSEVFDWTVPDQQFMAYRGAGLSIRSIRVLNAPGWAIPPDMRKADGSCRVQSCPPRPNAYDNFKRFIRLAANRYGPNSQFGINRFILWNEPNANNKWGGRGLDDGSARQYSDLLARFYNGAKDGDPDVNIDAGEIAAASPAGDNAPNPWARKFTRVNTDLGRNDHYQALTIHPFSENPSQVARKINNYNNLPGVSRVAPTAWGWSVGTPDSSSDSWQCAANEAAQTNKFLDSLTEIRTNTSDVGRVVWFNGVDNRIRFDKDAVCQNDYYDATDSQGDPLRTRMNNYGLYKRAPDGATEDPVPRAIADAFRTEAQRP